MTAPGLTGLSAAGLVTEVAAGQQYRHCDAVTGLADVPRPVRRAARRGGFRCGKNRAGPGGT
jgi:hypothetical protein